MYTTPHVGIFSIFAFARILERRVMVGLWKTAATDEMLLSVFAKISKAVEADPS